MLYEILYPQKDYIGANDMDKAVELYVKSHKNVDKVIITDHIQEAEYNIIKIKKKLVIKRISKGLKGFNVPMQTPVFFSGNYGNSNNVMVSNTIAPFSPPVPIMSSTTAPTPVAPIPAPRPASPAPAPAPVAPIPAPRPSASASPASAAPIITRTSPEPLGTPSISNIITSPSNPAIKTEPVLPNTTINISLPTSLDKSGTPYVVPKDTIVKQVPNVKVNNKIYKLNICVIYKNELWRVINIFKHKDEKYISIQSQYDSNKKAVIKYNRPSDPITGQIAKRIIKECISLLSKSEPAEQLPFQLPEDNPIVLPEDEMMKPEDENDLDEDWDYEEQNTPVEDLQINHKNNLEYIKELQNISDDDIELYLDILRNLEDIYACLYINKSAIQNQTELSKQLGDNINYIIKSKFFKNMFTNAIPVQTKLIIYSKDKTPEESEEAINDAIGSLKSIIQSSAINNIDNIKKYRKIDYEKCKSIANIEGLTNITINKLYEKEQSIYKNSV